MFCLANKYLNASRNVCKNALDCKRNKLQFINVARIPVILFKDMAGPCSGSSPKAAAGGSSGSASKNQIQYKPYVKPPYMDHDYKNMRLKRPMSPHLLIYTPTLPAMVSIWQRITGKRISERMAYVQRKYLRHVDDECHHCTGNITAGTIATFYAVLLSGGALFLSNGIDSYVSAIQSLELSRFSVLIIKIILGAPFAFHYFNGIRFVAFNSGRWLMKKDVYSTAFKAIIGTAVFSIIFALL